jgi:Rrf2 family protein
MDLTLSRTGDYAVRAAVCLASTWDGGSYVTIAHVVDDMDLPTSYTPQILGMLARAGIAESRPGRGGGYRLARPPEEISMLQVVESAEGSLANLTCPLSGGPCRWDDACAVHPTWAEVTGSVRAVLDRTSLEQVAREDRELGVSRRRRGEAKRSGPTEAPV